MDSVTRLTPEEIVTLECSPDPLVQEVVTAYQSRDFAAFQTELEELANTVGT